MAQEQSNASNEAQPRSPSSNTKAKKSAKHPQSDRAAKPTKPLPTNRVTFLRQLELLRAYAAASGPNGKVVTNADVAALVKMKSGTVSISNSFFADSGLLIRADGGYLPAPDVVSFQRVYEWNRETASYKLGPVISGTWFGKALLTKLSFKPMDEGEALVSLAEAASAGPGYRNQLRVCLEYLAAAGLIQWDGNLIRVARANGQGGDVADRPTAAADTKEPKVRASVATGFLTQPTEGVVQFNVSVRVDMKEFEGWEPQRIAAFFSGIAQVLAAKGAIEKEASG